MLTGIYHPEIISNNAVGAITIDCNSNITFIVERACSSVFSFKRIRKCESCEKTEDVNLCFVPFNSTVFENQGIDGIKYIESNICDSVANINSEQECECGGILKLQNMDFNNIIIVDVQNYKSGSTMIEINSLPKVLNLRDKTYFLFGIIEFSRLVPVEISEIGHYLCHVQRKNGEWQTFDDTKKKVSIPKTTVPIDIHALVYMCKE